MEATCGMKIWEIEAIKDYFRPFKNCVGKLFTGEQRGLHTNDGKVGLSLLKIFMVMIKNIEGAMIEWLMCQLSSEG